jgi:hypothetical protein
MHTGPTPFNPRTADYANEAAGTSTVSPTPEGESSADRGLSAAIALARRNRNLSPQQYYDENADAIDRQEYYRQLDVSAQPPAFYAALNRLITDTHQPRLDYSPSSLLYPDVDLQQNGNEFRANTPYFDFTPDGSPRADCGRAEPGRFEPVGGKGAVARATLYFLLRYPGEIDNNDREYTRERLDVLLRWHRETPVSLHEKHRNRTIQRNREIAIR